MSAKMLYGADRALFTSTRSEAFTTPSSFMSPCRIFSKKQVWAPISVAPADVMALGPDVAGAVGRLPLVTQPNVQCSVFVPRPENPLALTPVRLLTFALVIVCEKTTCIPVI